MSKIDDVMRAWQEDHQKVSWQDLQILKAENEALRAQLSEKNIGQGVQGIPAEKLTPVIQWLEAGCEPKHAVTELRMLASALPAPQQKPPTTSERRNEQADG